MNIEELKKDKTEYHVRVKIPSSELAKNIDEEISKLSKNVKMDGFRAGKVPSSIIKKKYLFSVQNDVATVKITNAIKQIRAEKKLNSVFDPELSDLVNLPGKDLEFTLKFETIGEITLPDFKKISLEKPILDVSEKEVEDQLKKIQDLSKDFNKEVKTKAKDGDQLTIDAVGYVDGEAFPGGKLESYKLILGSKTFIPGFEDQLIGAKAGDDVLVKVKFPDDYHQKGLAGKDSEFRVDVLAVHRSEDVKLDDELAKKFKCENIAQLKKQISDNIKSSYQEHIHILMKMRLFDKFEKLLDFDVPKTLLDRELDILKRDENKLSEEAEIKSMSEKEKENYFNKLAGRRVRIGLMLAEYVKRKKLIINETDIKNAIIAQARQFPGQEQQVVNFYQNNKDAIKNIEGPILEEKAVKVIFDHEINLTEKRYNRDKLEKLLETEIRD